MKRMGMTITSDRPVLKSYRALRHLYKNKGAMLVETLLAAIIVAVSFTALLQTELGTISDTRAVAGNIQAVALIANITDKMRNNPTAAKANDYVSSSSPGGTPCTSLCTDTQVADRDLIEWYNLIEDLKSSGEMPEASADIVSIGAGTFEITLSWKEYHTGSASAILTPVVNREITQMIFIE